MMKEIEQAQEEVRLIGEEAANSAEQFIAGCQELARSIVRIYRRIQPKDTIVLPRHYEIGEEGLAKYDPETDFLDLRILPETNMNYCLEFAKDVRKGLVREIRKELAELIARAASMTPVVAEAADSLKSASL